MLSAAAPIKSLRWFVFAEQPRSEAPVPVYRSLARAALLVLLGVVASIAASLLLARRMVRPIRALETGAREIGAGRLDRRIEMATGDELELLGEQFNRMAGQLQEIYATLEAKIADSRGKGESAPFDHVSGQDQDELPRKWNPGVIKHDPDENRAVAETKK